MNCIHTPVNTSFVKPLEKKELRWMVVEVLVSQHVFGQQNPTDGLFFPQSTCFSNTKSCQKKHFMDLFTTLSP